MNNRTVCLSYIFTQHPIESPPDARPRSGAASHVVAAAAVRLHGHPSGDSNATVDSVGKTVPDAFRFCQILRI